MSLISLHCVATGVFPLVDPELCHFGAERDGGGGPGVPGEPAAQLVGHAVPKAPREAVGRVSLAWLRCPV